MKIFLALSVSLLLSGYLNTVEAQHAPRAPQGIFGVKKNAVTKTQTYGSGGKGIREDYFNTSGGSTSTASKPSKSKNKNGNQDAPPQDAGQQAIPEQVIEQVHGSQF